uniref:Uncharacterized protein n=1 Tax=Glossina pallidipes TaxID=7398 RepID=A0A1A9ZDT9_GLOPL
MTSMQELIKLQTTTGGTIQRIIRNYKKDPVDRKGKTSYYHEKHRILSELWDAFETTDGKLRILAEDQTNIEYFDSQYYEQVQALTNEYLKIFSKEAKHHEPPHKQVILPNDGIGANAAAINKTGHGLIGKFNARSTALKRVLAGPEKISPNKPQQFYTVRIDTINKLWSQVEDLYDQIWEQVSDPLMNGLDQDNHDQLQSMLSAGCKHQSKTPFLVSPSQLNSCDILAQDSFIIISSSTVFLKKAVIAHVTAAPTHDIPQHEETLPVLLTIQISLSKSNKDTCYLNGTTGAANININPSEIPTRPALTTAVQAISSLITDQDRKLEKENQIVTVEIIIIFIL